VTVEWRPEAAAELLALDEQDEALGDAARDAVADVAGRHKTGKALGWRDTSGDLTGLCRLKFDLPGIRPERYRLVFQADGPTITVWAVGPRQGRGVYRDVSDRWSAGDAP
jgi:hypothetical protein